MYYQLNCNSEILSHIYIKQQITRCILSKQIHILSEIFEIVHQVYILLEIIYMGECWYYQDRFYRYLFAKFSNDVEENAFDSFQRNFCIKPKLSWYGFLVS